MANVFVGTLLRLKWYATVGDQCSINTTYYSCTVATGAPTQDSDVASGYAAVLPGFVKNLMSNQATYNGLTVQVVQPAPMPIPAANTGGSGVGALVSNVMPRQVAGLISCYAAFSGRRFRGRVYIPFPAVNQDDTGGLPLAGYVVLLNALKALIYGPIVIPNAGATGTVTLLPVIFHRATVTSTPVVTAVSRSKWATQRRRGSFGRPNVSPV